MPCHLLVPNNGKDKYPLTVCLSGHGGGMHVALGIAKTEQDTQALAQWPHRAMGLRSVKEGRCALVIGEQGHLNYADLLWQKLHAMGI